MAVINDLRDWAEQIAAGGRKAQDRWNSFLGGVTAGTAVANRVLVLGASRVIDFLDVTALTVTTIVGIPAAELQTTDPSQKITLFDDFLEGTLDASRWEDADGTDAEAIGPAIVANSLSGEILLTSGDVGDGGTPGNAAALVDGAAISGKSLMWQTDSGGLVIEVKVKLTTVAESILFVGFIDEVSIDSDVNLGIQASGTADVIKTEVGDAAGIIYDTSFQTSPTKFLLGSTKNTVVTTAVVHAAGPADGVYVTLRVELTAAGVLSGWVDGVAFGSSISAAITVADPLTPTVTVATNDTNESLATVDYIWVQQDRA